MADLDSPKIKHRSSIPFDRGTLIEDAVTFYVNNKVFEGFKNVNLSRNLMSLTGTFEISVLDKWSIEAQDFEILPGDRIHCHLGKIALFEGYVDTFTANLISGSRNLTITGRDRTSDLVDCSHDGASEFNNLDFEGLAKEMLKPFGLKVIKDSALSVGEKFSKFTIKQGETVFEALNRAAKERQLILLSSTHGNLLIEKRGVKRAASELKEGVNILSIGATFDNTERFSVYKVKGQQAGILGSPTDTNASLGEATDEGITRFRPNIVLAENAVNNDGAQKRAEFEAGLRVAKGLKVTISVKGWRQEDGSLWAINQLVQVESPSVGIKSQMLVQSVKYTKTTAGRKTDIELIRKDSLEFKKTTKKKDDLLQKLGITK